MTLSEFLLARIAEDEAAARDAMEDSAPADPNFDVTGWPDCEWPGRVVIVGPERFLAECDAKRQRIEWVAQVAAYSGDGDAYLFASGVAEKSLQFDALPYANHPDYDEGWRP